MNTFSPYYQFAHDFALQTNRSIFLTGKAGTGKTTFLHTLKTETKKQMAVVAPTGVAAINAGGTTMHSFFQLPFSPFIPTVEGRKNLIEKIKMTGFRRKVLQELELLVIDEISMVRADVLDAVDTILRHFRYRYSEPFGGVQLIFIGDLFQLSPVALDDEWRLLSVYYTTPYFFHSQVIQQQQPVYIEFDKIFRQTNINFIKLLNEVRNNALSPDGFKLLESRYNPLFRASKEDTFITLTTHNYKADKINAEELIKLNGRTFSFEAKIHGDFPEKSFPTDKTLILKMGAKVMFVKNDTQNPRRFFNGKIGIIQDIKNDKIYIKCPEDQENIEIEPMVWENIRYTTNEMTKQIEEDKIGSFEQFPLRLAWAITIHKSQGLTFDKAIIDAGEAFASGQVYVALSRCRSIEGMVLWSKINPYSLENDRAIVEHEQNKLSIQELDRQLVYSRNQFRIYILAELFDFKTSVGHASRLLREIEEVKKSFNDETLPYLKDIQDQAQKMQDVAVKFQHQLESILSTTPMNEDFLQERLQSAIDFFRLKIENLIETILQSPATTDSRENARDYTDQLRQHFAFLTQKMHIFKGIVHPFSVEQYFDLKSNFFIPEFSANAYAKAGSAKTASSRNPNLYFQLLALRNKLCEPNDLPIYVVAGTKTLLEMADYLPQNEKDLLRIFGFGPTKVEKFGDQFLKIITDYCKEYKLSSRMDEKIASKKESKEKKEKKTGETYRISYEMYTSGKTIDEIAEERGLTTGTIAGHLGRYIISGQLNIDDFVSENQRNKALKLIENAEEIGSIYSLLSNIMNQTEVSFFLNWMRNNKKIDSPS